MDLREPENVCFQTMKLNANNVENPLAPWYTAKIVGKTANRTTFEFNAERRGWHYGWFATKSTRDMQHAFKVYVYFAPEIYTDTLPLSLVATKTSANFSVCCTKRSKPDGGRKKVVSEDGDGSSSPASEGSYNTSNVSNVKAQVAHIDTKPSGGRGRKKHAYEKISPLHTSSSDDEVIPTAKRARLMNTANVSTPYVNSGPGPFVFSNEDADSSPHNAISDSTTISSHDFDDSYLEDADLEYYEMPEDVSAVWREDEIRANRNHLGQRIMSTGSGGSSNPNSNNSIAMLAPTESVTRELSSYNYFIQASNVSADAMPSAPSWNRMNSPSSSSTTSTKSMVERFKEIFARHEGNNQAPMTPFSSPEVKRTVRLPNGEYSYDPSAQMAYPVPPPSLYRSLLENMDENGTTGKTRRSSTRRKYNEKTERKWCTPIMGLVLLLLAAVAYLVYDKVHTAYIANGGTSSKDVVPSWLMQEFSLVECKCASYAAMKRFCSIHEQSCATSMLESSEVDANTAVNNQVSLATWIISNKVCLADACATTGNESICAAAGTKPPSVAPTGKVSPARNFDDLCDHEQWEPYSTAAARIIEISSR